MRTINGQPTIDLATIGHAEGSIGRADNRAPVYSLTQAKLGACIVEAARSTGPIPMDPALHWGFNWSETMYGVAPNGGDTVDN